MTRTFLIALTGLAPLRMCQKSGKERVLWMDRTTLIFTPKNAQAIQTLARQK